MSENYFYQDAEKEIIKEDLLTTKALEWAKNFVSPKKGEKYEPKNPQLSSAQLRRFYHDVKSLESKVKENFDRTKPLIKMLKSKVAYACPEKGKDRKVPLEFRKFLEEMVDNINTQKDFAAFCLVFEAVVGYFYGEGGK